MKVKKLLIPLLLLISLMFALTGCGNQYNAVLIQKPYSELKGYLNETFLEENRIYGAYYLYDDIPDGYRIEDEAFPRTRTFIIKSQNEFNEIFTSKPQELNIDFENQMLIIYSCRSIYHRTIKIKAVQLDGSNLNISMRMKDARPGVGDASMPYQLYLFITMDKADITTANCELLNAR